MERFTVPLQKARLQAFGIEFFFESKANWPNDRPKCFNAALRGRELLPSVGQIKDIQFPITDASKNVKRVFHDQDSEARPNRCSSGRAI